MFFPRYTNELNVEKLFSKIKQKIQISCFEQLELKLTELVWKIQTSSKLSSSADIFTVPNSIQFQIQLVSKTALSPMLFQFFNSTFRRCLNCVSITLRRIPALPYLSSTTPNVAPVSRCRQTSSNSAVSLQTQLRLCTIFKPSRIERVQA